MIPNFKIALQAPFSTSPKNSSSPKALPNINKVLNTFPAIISKDEIKKQEDLTTSPIKTIRLRNFKVQRNIIEERMKSLSPKLKENSSINKHVEEGEIVKKYKKIRIENQDQLIKINNLFGELLENKNFDVKKNMETCFEIISSVFRHNKFDEEAEIILKIFKENIFVTDNNDLNVIQEILNEKIGSFHQILWKDLFCGLKDEFLKLREIYEKKVEFLEKSQTNLFALNEAKKIEILNLTEALKEKEQSNITFLKENTEKIREMAIENKNLLDRNNKLLDDHKLEISHLIKKQEESEKGYESLMKETLADLEQWKTKFEKKENEIQSLKSEKERAIEDFKISVNTLKRTKEKISKFEENVSDLMTENQNLKLRAAVSFDELTPRPSFDKFNELFEFSEIAFKNKSSKEITETIFLLCQKSHNEKKKKSISKSRNGTIFKNLSPLITPRCSNDNRANFCYQNGNSNNLEVLESLTCGNDFQKKYENGGIFSTKNIGSPMKNGRKSKSPELFIKN